MIASAAGSPVGTSAATPFAFVGVDGCRGAWLAVGQARSPSRLLATLCASAADVLAAFPTATVIAVDVPIGLADGGPRDCDLAARRLLGKPRMTNVFPAPIRPALEAETREAASRITQDVCGRRVGCQAWGIYPYVRAWDALLRQSPDARRRVFEAHPEVCFWAMNGRAAMLNGKKTAAGQRERRALLNKEFGAQEIARALTALQGERFGLDDFFDAVAALWSARRIAAGNFVSPPVNPPPRDACGVPMAIHY